MADIVNFPFPVAGDFARFALLWDAATTSAETVRNVMYDALGGVLTVDQRRQLQRHVAFVRVVANDPRLAALFLPAEDCEQDETVKPPMPDIEIADFVKELGQMYLDDPKRMTEEQDAFISAATKPRTREIGQQIHELGGKNAMLRVHDAIQEAHGRDAAGMLRLSWAGIGDWYAGWLG